MLFTDIDLNEIALECAHQGLHTFYHEIEHISALQSKEQALLDGFNGAMSILEEYQNEKLS